MVLRAALAAPSHTPETSGLKSPAELDASEPRYCICNRVSYGEMIACDNPDCSIEWFHFNCVGISQMPKGKWYCPNCAPLFKQTKGTKDVQQR